MGKHRNIAKAGGSMHKDASPNPSPHGGELYDTVQVFMEEVASLMGASPKMPFRFAQWSRLPPPTCSTLLEDQWAITNTPMIGCLIVTLWEGSVDQPPASHTWSGSLITNILQVACPGD